MQHFHTFETPVCFVSQLLGNTAHLWSGLVEKHPKTLSSVYKFHLKRKTAQNQFLLQSVPTKSVVIPPPALSEEEERMLLAKKEQELLMLQRKKIEMELEQTRKQLEMAEKNVKKVCFYLNYHD